MKLDEKNPANGLLIAYYLKLAPAAPSLATPDSVPLPYMRLGSHPDIVERVWDQLNSALPVNCRAVIYGSPALVNPESGVVITLAFGTRYVLRVSEDHLKLALAAGCTITQTWLDGTTTDISKEFGKGWLFGCCKNAEKDWLLASYTQAGAPTATD